MYKFRSRVSVLLLVIIVASFIPVLFFEEPIEDASERYLAYGILALTFGLLLAVLFTLTYEFEDGYLLIKIGPFPYSRTKISDIESVQRSYNPLSAPASSLKRLYINTKSKNVLVSPVNEKEFVGLLKARNPTIEVNIVDKDDWWRFWDWDI